MSNEILEEASVDKQKVSSRMIENERYLKEKLGIGITFDIGVRKLSVLEKELQIYFLNGLCDSQFIIELLKELMFLDATEKQKQRVKEQIENRLTHVQVERVKTLDEATDQLLAGLIIILIEDETEAILVDVRSYPGRGPDEPDTERVVRGARDGFTENLIVNTALTRRRIKDERLRHEIVQVGERSKTDICIAYIKDVADPAFIENVKKELDGIKIDGISMADKVVEEFIVKQGINPFPLVRYTERPDVTATHLLEGHVVIYVDTSPSVIILPTTFFHHVQHAEEFRQAPIVGTFLRWVRFSGMIFALLILPLWLLMVMEPSLLPAALDFIGPNETTNVPVFAQIVIAEIGIELLRMAAIHTPSPLATALGLVAALLIGEIAINVGLFIPEVILYVALGAIGTFATPSYELGIALKLSRLVLLLAVFIFKVPGFIIGFTVFFIFLTSIRPMNTPYLWPFIPFYPRAFADILFRLSVPLKKKRPKIVNPQNSTKQSTN
ncbi:spore germination protein [Anaerobacillus sp. CMMVII]|uniref:spore germination protein n=1 Tax=Anaerobacillus sp. CMMVII TaxID=2755588 RepID=UPI0021C4F075|nr:spore germination protein [Anaerobacillus sp. CMMVII]MCT8138807.1 spore germination protein [Anaerobacillus sp. CMMVII]